MESISGTLTSILDSHYVPQQLLAHVENVLLAREKAGQILSLSELKEYSEIDALFSATICRAIEFSVSNWKVSANIYFCYVARPDIANALAMRLPDGSYVIALFEGLVGQLVRFATLMVRTEEIGKTLNIDASRYKVSRSTYKDLPMVGGLIDLGTLEDEDVKNSVPLLLGMAGVIGFHEIAHIIDGHLDFLAGVGCAAHDEFSDIRQDGPEGLLTLEALEFDADAFSAAGWGALLLGGRGVPVALAPFRDPLEKRFEFIALTVGGVLLYDDLFTIDDLCWATKAASHSPPKVRLNNVQATLVELLRKYHGYSYEQGAALIVPIEIALQIASLMFKGADLPSGMGSLWEKEREAQEQYTNRIFGRWARLRPCLSQLKLSSQNLAPAQADPI